MSRDPPRRDKTVNAIGESKPPRMLAGTKKRPGKGMALDGTVHRQWYVYGAKR